MFGEEVTIFKVLSTLAVFLFGTTWAYRNIRDINNWIAEKTGIGTVREGRVRTSTEEVAVETSNTATSNTAE